MAYYTGTKKGDNARVRLWSVKPQKQCVFLHKGVLAGLLWFYKKGDDVGAVVVDKTGKIGREDSIRICRRKRLESQKSIINRQYPRADNRWCEICICSHIAYPQRGRPDCLIAVGIFRSVQLNCRKRHSVFCAMHCRSRTTTTTPPYHHIIHKFQMAGSSSGPSSADWSIYELSVIYKAWFVLISTTNQFSWRC